jgi:uncharacterized protein YndB with AHSA1/START domain
MAVTRSGSAVVTLPTEEQILITREFAAPKHLVYKAWTTPELVKRWWASELGEVTIAEIDLRVGGRWRYVMVTEDGTEVAFHGEYRAIVPNERIVSTEVFEAPGASPDEPDDAHVPVNVVTFTDSNGGTILTLLVQCPNKELRDMIVSSGMETGMQKAWDLLEQVAISLV